jgi:hypothetical protein
MERPWLCHGRHHGLTHEVDCARCSGAYSAGNAIGARRIFGVNLESSGSSNWPFPLIDLYQLK